MVRRNRTTKLRKYLKALRKGKLLVLWNVDSGHHQTNGDEGKNKKRVTKTNKKVSRS